MLLSSDRNLLFGILALQLGFIRRDALVHAVQTWLNEKQRPLGEILVVQGAIEQQHHDLMISLVEAHLRRHGDDTEQSLAALGPLGSVRDELVKLGDGSLNQTLQLLACAHDQDSMLTMAGEAPRREVSAGGKRFRVLRPHARGGLGEVHVALDIELNREVALKEIQQRHADNPESRARFMLEAEITGQLEHPGIVPVYGLGQYFDGRPFYAMRFIRGNSLREAIENYYAGRASRDAGERAIELRKLLGRFVDVCEALQYAHDRGVLHRDLKPGNIMLGKYGETLVVDWGLAKAVGKPDTQVRSDEPTLHAAPAAGSAATAMGATLGTPQFMSPEQAAGRLDQLGGSSDVYSLGATLYCLLTGQAPFGNERMETVLQKVQAGEFARPRDIEPDVSPALEAICLKAMALRPEDRYSTPNKLSTDIENWLADEPVSAWTEPWSARLARWARRHRTLVEALVCVILAAALAMTLAAGWQRQVAQQERRARLLAEQLEENNLLTAARFAARTIAYEIDLRWWILKGAASDSDLHRLMTTLAQVDDAREQAERLELQDWISARFAESNRTGATSWFIIDRYGRLIARHPFEEEVVGRDFSFRDYFHGQGCELPEGSRTEPIRDVYRSLVFESQATGSRVVAFTVPIWNGPAGISQILGVLGMTVELGAFGGLQLAESTTTSIPVERVVALVDLRADALQGALSQGFVLQHPGLEAATPLTGVKRRPPRLTDDQIDRLNELRKAVLQAEPIADSRALDRAFHDPVEGPQARPWLAAFAPVLISGRNEGTRDTGWVVIVQQR